MGRHVMEALGMSRVVMEDGKAQEVDCSFYQCPHAPACGIAEKIRDLLAGENP